MKTWVIALIVQVAIITNCIAQVNVVLLHQLVGQSESEHARQQDARDKQLLLNSGEQINSKSMERLQSTYGAVTARLKVLNLVISAGQIGLQASPIIDEIVEQQRLIFRQAAKDPLLLTLAYGAEADLADQAYQLSNYLYGLLLSMGDVNQMKASDRRILFAHVLSELRRMAGASQGLAMSMQHAVRLKLNTAINPFSGYVNKDKQLIEIIMRNASNIKYY
jgi:hypothetical protein